MRYRENRNHPGRSFLGKERTVLGTVGGVTDGVGIGFHGVAKGATLRGVKLIQKSESIQNRYK